MKITSVITNGVVAKPIEFCEQLAGKSSAQAMGSSTLRNRVLEIRNSQAICAQGTGVGRSKLYEQLVGKSGTHGDVENHISLVSSRSTNSQDDASTKISHEMSEDCSRIPSGVISRGKLDAEKSAIGIDKVDVDRSRENNATDDPDGACRDDGLVSKEYHRFATVIQRKWKEFIGGRKKVVGDLLEMLPLMGGRIEKSSDFRLHMANGRIVVQMNGNADNPLAKHSAIYYKNASYELVLGDAPDNNTLAFSKYGLSESSVSHARKNIPWLEVGYRSMIDRGYPDHSKVAHLVDKGRIFVLHEEYSPYFAQACEQATKQLRDSPYSYGIHYNCHVFVQHFLKNLHDIRNCELYARGTLP
ncbi:hypothetical protein [Burkholderia pyrrocinia]